MAADATPHCEGCPVAADAVNSTQAAQWPSKCAPHTWAFTGSWPVEGVWGTKTQDPLLYALFSGA